MRLRLLDGGPAERSGCRLDPVVELVDIATRWLKADEGDTDNQGSTDHSDDRQQDDTTRRPHTWSSVYNDGMP